VGTKKVALDIQGSHHYRLTGILGFTKKMYLLLIAKHDFIHADNTTFIVFN